MCLGNVFDVGVFFSPPPLHVGKKRFVLCLFSQLPVKSSYVPKKDSRTKKKSSKKLHPGPAPVFCHLAWCTEYIVDLYLGVGSCYNWTTPYLAGPMEKTTKIPRVKPSKWTSKVQKKERMAVAVNSQEYITLSMIKTITKKIAVIQESPVVSFVLVGCG